MLFKEPSFLDDTSAYHTLETIISAQGEINRRFAVAAVDTNTGDYIAMTQEDTTVDTLAQSCLASASIPLTFPNQHMNGYSF